jgi:hypothetical protein
MEARRMAGLRRTAKVFGFSDLSDDSLKKGFAFFEELRIREQGNGASA